MKVGKTERITEKDVIRDLYSYTFSNRHIWAYRGYYPPSFINHNLSYGQIEFDFIKVTRNHYVYEFEIKLSVGDFRNEQKKRTKWEMIANNTYPAILTYVMPESVFQKVEIPENCGIITFVKTETQYLYSQLDRKMIFTTIRNPSLKSRKKNRTRRFNTYFNEPSLQTCKIFIRGNS